MATLKTKNKEEVKEIAKGIFERYPRANSVAVTSDGTAFITDESDIAVRSHSTKNRYGKKLAITEFLREEFDKPKKSESDKPKTAKDLIAEINADGATVESVAAIIAAEKAGEQRKTVLEAANAKLETLKANL